MADTTALSLLILTLCSTFFYSHSLNNTLHSSSSSSSSSSAHVELSLYGFPVGLLPQNVSSYHLNHTSGLFSVDLTSDCVFLLPPDDYLASFSKTLSGSISHGSITHLRGIRVRAFFSWWSISAIRSSGHDLVFHLGYVTAKYPSNSFLHSPSCLHRTSSSS